MEEGMLIQSVIPIMGLHMEIPTLFNLTGITSMIADLEPTTVSVDISTVARQILCSTSVDVDLIKLNIKIYKHCG